MIVRVVICRNIRDVKRKSFEFYRDNADKVLKVEKIYPILIQLYDGTKHIFMTGITYENWCIGRTYLLDGILYHSGYMVTKGEKND